MQTITLAAFKGGVGKTLLTATFATIAADHAAGRRRPDDHGGVAILDLDPQGSLTEWANGRKTGGPMLVQAGAGDLDRLRHDLSDRGVRTLLIDTPPGHGEIVVAAMAAADRVIIPAKPGDLDFKATLRTQEVALALERPHALLPIDATFRVKAMGALITALRDTGYPVLPAIHHRVALALRIGAPTLAERSPRSKGTQEVTSVWRAIRALLDGGAA